MDSTRFPQVNLILTAPPNMTAEECHSLPVYTDGERCISRWVPSAEDLERLMAGGAVWLWVVSGTTMPPVALTTDDPFASAGAATKP